MNRTEGEVRRRRRSERPCFRPARWCRLWWPALLLSWRRRRARQSVPILSTISTTRRRRRRIRWLPRRRFVQSSVRLRVSPLACMRASPSCYSCCHYHSDPFQFHTTCLLFFQKSSRSSRRPTPGSDSVMLFDFDADELGPYRLRLVNEEMSWLWTASSQLSVKLAWSVVAAFQRIADAIDTVGSARREPDRLVA